MCERREIATGAYRTLFWNDWVHTAIEHFAKHLNHLKANTAEAECEHVRAQQHHCAHFRLRKWLTDSAGVAANKVELKFTQGVAWNTNVREFAKPRCNAVNNSITRNDFFDDPARRQNTRSRERGNLDRLPT